MSTHATIAIKRDDGTVASYYLHYDGYLSGAGKKLARQNYKEFAERLDTGRAIKSIHNSWTVPEFFTDTDGVHYFKDESEFLESDEVSDREHTYYWNGEEWLYLVEGDCVVIPLKNIKFKGE